MLSEEHGIVKHLSRTATIVAVVAWLIVGGFTVMWTIWYGKDLASAILDVLALLIGAVGAYCLGRAVDARRERVGLLWAGRALGLFGAAVADGVFHLGGVNYFPEARTDLAAFVMSNGPAVLTAALLLIGSEGWRGEEGGTFPSSAVAAAR
jgi:hypothetical protein